jgi:hypothetical protein
MTCHNEDCGATVILPSIASGKKHFNQSADRLDVTCPACSQIFSMPIFELEWLEVNDDEFSKGFFGGKKGHGWPFGHRRHSEGSENREPADRR